MLTQTIFECIPTSGTANRLYEFDANGVEYQEDASVGDEQYLLVFENKDTIYDICDAVRCTKSTTYGCAKRF